MAAKKVAKSTKPKKRTFIRKSDKEKKKVTAASVKKKVTRREPEKVQPELREEVTEEAKLAVETPYERHVHSSESTTSGLPESQPEKTEELEVVELVTGNPTVQPVADAGKTPDSQEASTTTPSPIGLSSVSSPVVTAETPSTDLQKAEGSTQEGESGKEEVTDGSMQQAGQTNDEKLVETAESLEPKKKNFLPKVLFFVVVTLLLIGIILIFLSLNVKNKGSMKQTNTVTVRPTQIPSPTSLPVPEPSEYSVVILNGSGISGEASKIRTLLTDADYSVTSIGNATSSAYLETVIQTTPEVSKEWVSELRTLLLDTYETVIVEELNEDSDLEVVLLLGSDKK